MNRIYTQYQLAHVVHMLINIIFVPVTVSLTSFSFVTLLSVSFLYNEQGNKYIELQDPLVSREAYSLLSVLHIQLIASIFGGILFSLELYVELFRSTTFALLSSSPQQQQQKKRSSVKKGYRKSKASATAAATNKSR